MPQQTSYFPVTSKPPLISSQTTQQTTKNDVIQTARQTNLLELIQSKQYDDDLSCENNNEENSSQPNIQRYGSSTFKQVPFLIEHHEEYDLALQKLQPSTKTRKTIIQRNLAKGNF
jgi:predicted transposase YbfD/YdcC